jgi:hypothetical protein
VFSELIVSNGAIEWNGLFLGMSVEQLGSLLGETISPTKASGGMGPPGARVVVKKRIIEVYFTLKNDQLVLMGFVVKRMGFDDPESWTQRALVDALRTRVPGVRFVPSDHPSEPSEDLDSSPVYVFPDVDGVKLLLQPDEGAIFVGSNAFFVD